MDMEPSMRAFHRATLFTLATALPLPLVTYAADTPAQPPAAAAPRAPLIERSEQEAQALARQLPAQEQQTLQAGGDNFLALWRPANDPDPAGMVIIVPGAGETANWPDTVAPLRSKLPDARWSTLSLTLPDLLSEAMQPRGIEPPAPAAAGSSATPPDANAPIEQAAASGADPTAPTQPTTPDDQLKTDAARIFARIDAGIAFAQQVKARSIVLLGHGTGAYWAARYLSERQPSRAQRLVMVAGKTPEAAPSGLDQLAPQLKVPVADIYYATTPNLRSAAVQRLQASKRQPASQYSQTELTPLPGDQDSEREQLVRRVRGWLSPKT